MIIAIFIDNYILSSERANVLIYVYFITENAKLKARIKELQLQLDETNKELQEVRELNEAILTINEEFGRENDELYKKLEAYKNLRRPRSMLHSRKHSRSEDKGSPYKRKREYSKSDNEMGSYESDSDNDTRRVTNVTEKNEKYASVCIIFF